MTTTQNENKEVRRNEVKQFWVVMVNVEGFEGVMLAYGTRTEVLSYFKGTLGFVTSFRYRSASEEDVANARKLGIKAYFANI